MGCMIEGRLELRPEEGLYLMECSQLGGEINLVVSDINVIISQTRNML